jgi:5'-nucleotidase
MLRKLHIYHTNDLHSHFINWPKIASYLKKQHEQCQRLGEEYLTVDIGDHADRSHLLTEGSEGKANVTLLNELAYDYTTIGNNEGITFDYNALNNLYNKAQFKVVLSNITDNSHTIPSWATPYLVHDTQSGLKIGVIGVTAPFYQYFELLGWHAQDPIETIKNYITEIKEQTDLIILLSHLGYDQDRSIAEEIEGIDIILGGHTHHILHDGVTINSTLINQAGREGNFIGHIEITYDDADRSIKSKKASCIDTSFYENDNDTVTLLEDLENEARSKLQQPIVRLNKAIPVKWFSSSSPLADLLADTVREWCEADLGMINAGVLLNGLVEGEVTRETLHQICPHPINACKVILRGELLKEIILQSLTKEMVNKRFKGLGFRGEVMGMMVYSGVEVEGVVLQDGEFHVREIIINDQLIKYDKMYTVATLDMFTFGSFYPSIAHNKHKTYYLPHMLRDLLAWKLKRLYKHR